MLFFTKLVYTGKVTDKDRGKKEMEREGEGLLIIFLFIVCYCHIQFGRAARLAQSVEHQTFNLRVKGSSPLSGLSHIFVTKWLCFCFALFFLVLLALYLPC